MGKFIGIGIGVGDHEMLTIKGVNALKTLDVVILPEAESKDESTAYSIVKDYLTEESLKLFLKFSMMNNIKDREKSREENFKKIEEYLSEGKKVGFITIGDPMVYSTYSYMLEKIDKKYEVETVPGITSFLDMASRLNMPLVLGDEDLKIISLNEEVDIEKEILNSDNIIFMKIYRDFNRLKNYIKKLGYEKNIVVISNSGKKEQKIFYNLSDINIEEIGYFSTLILKKRGIQNC